LLLSHHDESKWRALIFQGKTISDEASFCVLHEICRKPISVDVSKQELLTILYVWRQENDHPLAQQTIEAAEAITTNNYLSVDRFLELLRQVQKHPNQYNALSIIYFACDDVQGKADKKYDEIVNYCKAS
jgi:dTDP-D-glucose 4,6-dehydratase